MALDATVGVFASLDVWTAAGFTEADEAPYVHAVEGSPPGMAFVRETRTLDGTPTTAGTYPLIVATDDIHGNPVEGDPVTVNVAGDPASQLAGEVGTEVSLDVWSAAGFDMGSPLPDYADPVAGEVPGLAWVDATRTLDGNPTTAGSYALTVTSQGPFGNPIEENVTVTIAPSTTGPGDGDGDGDGGLPEPGSGDPWELWDGLATGLAPRVAAFVGRSADEDTLDAAKAQIPVVAEYIRGFTRGRGFVDDSPNTALRAVLVSAVARLATNPEQVAVFTTGDYSERPAQLAGWTLTELAVLRRYRRVTA